MFFSEFGARNQFVRHPGDSGGPARSETPLVTLHWSDYPHRTYAVHSGGTGFFASVVATPQKVLQTAGAD